MQPLPPRTRPHSSPRVSRRAARSRKSGTVSLAKTDPLCTSARVFGSIRIGTVRFRYFRPQTADLCKRGFFASREFTNASTGGCKRSCFRSSDILFPPTRYSAMSLRRLSPRPSVPLPRLKQAYRAKARTGAFQKSYPREQGSKQAASIYQ